jgi:hypothetical protein
MEPQREMVAKRDAWFDIRLKTESYSDEQIRRDIKGVKDVYASLGRGKLEIYKYLTAAYRVDKRWGGPQYKNICRRAARLADTRIAKENLDSAFWVVIEVTYPDNTVQAQKNKSAYKAALRRAGMGRIKSDDLAAFLIESGGIKPTRRRRGR